MTSEGKRGVRNVATAVVGQGSNLLVMAIAAIALPRALGPTDYGQFSAALATVAILFSLASLGLPIVEARFLSPLARSGDRASLEELASSLWAARMLAALVAASLVYLWIAWSPTGEPATTAWVIGLFAAARYLFQGTRSLLLPLDRVTLFTFLEVLHSVAFVASCLVGYAVGGLVGAFGIAAPSWKTINRHTHKISVVLAGPISCAAFL